MKQQPLDVAAGWRESKLGENVRGGGVMTANMKTSMKILWLAVTSAIPAESMYLKWHLAAYRGNQSKAKSINQK